MTAQDIADAVSVDMRRLISNSGADLLVILGWIDRVHKEVLHSSVYAAFNIAQTTISTVASQSVYTLPPDVRRVRTIYNRTLSQLILPLEPTAEPATAMEHATPAIGGPQAPDAKILTIRVHGPFPLYYQRVGNQLILFPEPRLAGNSIEVTYEKTVPTITSAVQPLTVPDDGKDVMVAGVNALAAMYLKRNDEAQHWYAVYQKLLGSETQS
jgi:hypothetical protein